MNGGHVSGAKGLLAEENLRNYFLEAGYFVARGVSLFQGDVEVTDVDLWLYHRTSAIHRSRTNVDIKSRQKAKAFERVLWAKGVQSVLGLDDAIVATTDKRPNVKAFANKNGIKVLDGDFLQRLQSRTQHDRLTEEEFDEKIGESGMDRLCGGWRDRLHNSKGRLVSALDFHGCNFWLAEIGRFFSDFASGSREESALRGAYLNAAYFHIGLDFRYQAIAFETQETRYASLLHGFRFGEQDIKPVEQILRDIAPQVARELRNAAVSGREGILAQFFSEHRVMTRLFDVARRFEAAAYARQVPYPDALDADLKIAVGMFADHIEMDRRRILRPGPTGDKQGAPPA